MLEEKKMQNCEKVFGASLKSWTKMFSFDNKQENGLLDGDAVLLLYQTFRDKNKNKMKKIEKNNNVLK
jgi:hypothetical protein